MARDPAARYRDGDEAASKLVEALGPIVEPMPLICANPKGAFYDEGLHRALPGGEGDLATDLDGRGGYRRAPHREKTDGDGQLERPRRLRLLVAAAIVLAVAIAGIVRLVR